MIQGRFFQNPDFAEYVRLLGRLHRLIREDRDESEEGEALRDAMDRPGEALSDEEGRQESAISADLASIYSDSGETRIQPTAAATSLLSIVVQAINHRDAIRALSILREHASEFPPADLARLRGEAFAAVGQHEIAADFLEHAKELAAELVR